MRTTKKKSGRFRVGDWVSFLFGPENMFAQIAEVRGRFGADRTYIYRIRVIRDNEEVDSFELREEALELAAPPDKEAIINYLKEGGLVAILRGHLGDRRDQPKAWLTYKPRGEVTHTFRAEHGVGGGAAVPYFALHEDKVYTGKKEQVIAFLTSFGISRADAEAVVAAVGTAP